MFAQITLLSPPFATLDYRVPDWFPANFVKPGLRVAVPLGKSGQMRSAYVESISQEAKDGIENRAKDIIWPLEVEPVLNPDLLALSKSLSVKLALKPGIIFGHSLPAGLRSTRLRLKGKSDGKLLSLKDIHSLPEAQKKKLLQDFLNGEAETFDASQDRGSRQTWSLAVDPPWKLRPQAKRQIALLDFLFEHGACARNNLVRKFGSSCGTLLRSLLNKGYVKAEIAPEVPATAPIAQEPVKLNAEQAAAVNQLSEILAQKKAACHLLHGITGSGKTAVYLALIRKSLEQGRSALLLAPEVALAARLRQIASAALPDAPTHLFHGYQSPAAREKIFLELAKSRKPALVIGTRSALFLPLFSPGIIILDEEHDASFKQDEIFAYHGRDAAWQRAINNRALMLLGSATPDIRTFYAASKGSIGISRLTRRATGGSLPAVELARMEADNASAAIGTTGSILTRECENALAECVKRGEQAIILLNRRGYSPLMFCPSCSKTVHCPNCDVALAWHKNINKLVCHYCGYARPYPSPCPSCGRINLLPLGEGTEKLEEKLQTIAYQPILRLDRDNARRQGRMEEIMQAFAAGSSPFLVGTQMISKGHHFPNVTLVVAADGDMGLNLPDYRSAERTFQLLVQTAGRAGRGEKPGKVLIQTRNPAHYCWEYVKTADYAGFYEQELKKRKKYLYPPFTKLALLRLSTAESGERLAFGLESIAKELKTAAASSKLILMGPAPAPLALIRGQKRFHFLIKADSWDKVRNLYFHALKQPEARIFKIFLDIDPINML